MRTNHNNVNYEIEIRGEYGFYGDAIKVVGTHDGMVAFKFLTGCQEGMYNECEIEEFAEQNPEIVLDPEEV